MGAMKADGKMHTVRKWVEPIVLAILAEAICPPVYRLVFGAAVSNTVWWNWVMTIAIPLVVGGVAFLVRTWDDKIRIAIDALRADVTRQLDETRAKLESLPTAETLRADITLRLDDQFDRLKKDGTRHKAALAIWSQTNLEDVEDVLDFFESIGVYLKRGVLDEQLISECYCYWIVRYHAFTKDYVPRRRKELGSSEYWKHFDELDACMRKLNPEELGDYSNEQRRKFLAEEGVTDAEFEKTKT